MSKIVRLGFLGFGVIGSKVYELLQENHERIEREYGIKIVVEAIYVRNPRKKRPVMVVEDCFTDCANEVVGNSNIDVCIECLGGGGTEAAKEYILLALEHGQDIVMSSKKCLALYENEIEQAAKKYGCTVRMEASVGGSIPIMSTLREIAKGERIQKVYGILNATSNYILSSMSAKQTGYQEALEQAKLAGFAENDPSEDVKGKDAAYKLALLIKKAFGQLVPVNQIRTETIEEVTPSMLEDARSEGKVMKQIAYAEMLSDGTIRCYVQPKKVSEHSLLAMVEGNNNLIILEGSHSGMRAFYGQGAGADATASVIVDDLVDIIKG